MKKLFIMIAAMFVLSGFVASNSADASIISNIRGKVASTAIGKPGTEAYCHRPDFNKSCHNVKEATTFGTQCAKFKTKPAVRSIMKSCKGSAIVTAALKGDFGADGKSYMEHLVSAKNIKAFLAEKAARKQGGGKQHHESEEEEEQEEEQQEEQQEEEEEMEE